MLEILYIFIILELTILYHVYLGDCCNCNGAINNDLNGEYLRIEWKEYCKLFIGVHQCLKSMLMSIIVQATEQKWSKHTVPRFFCRFVTQQHNLLLCFSGSLVRRVHMQISQNKRVNSAFRS
uniref:Putative secreted protein n=1 Tax=Rhipicephalus microplus TaxID=6941 RepID=A0A6G5A1Z5_RHIMP